MKNRQWLLSICCGPNAVQLFYASPKTLGAFQDRAGDAQTFTRFKNILLFFMSSSLTSGFYFSCQGKKSYFSVLLKIDQSCDLAISLIQNLNVSGHTSFSVKFIHSFPPTFLCSQEVTEIKIVSNYTIGYLALGAQYIGQINGISVLSGSVQSLSLPFSYSHDKPFIEKAAPYPSVSLAFEAIRIAKVATEAQSYICTYRILVTNLRFCSTALTSYVKQPAC